MIEDFRTTRSEIIRFIFERVLNSQTQSIAISSYTLSGTT